MQRTASVFVIALTSLILAGCGGDSHEKAAKEMVGITEEIGDILASIQEADDIKPAMEKVDGVIERVEKLIDRVAELGEPDEATEKRLSELFDRKIEENIARWQTEAERINRDVVKNNPALGIPIQTAFMKLGVAMMRFAEPGPGGSE